jgi:hypothetical protein
VLPVAALGSKSGAPDLSMRAQNMGTRGRRMPPGSANAHVYNLRCRSTLIGLPRGRPCVGGPPRLPAPAAGWTPRSTWTAQQADDNRLASWLPVH